MHFQHPELLYALFLLLIPVLVHLFRLRRFRKEKFTNVKFLRKAVQQTRKSSEIKRWLVLCLRMLALACIVLAFAQPFIPASEASLKERTTVIYLDNSYSMQVKGRNGILLKRAVQDLLERLPEGEEFSLFTNDSEFRELNNQELRQKLQDLSYSPTQLDAKEISLKAETMFSGRGNYQRNFIAVSDFQHKKGSESYTGVPGAENYLVQLQPEVVQNVFVDTAFVSSKSLDAVELSIGLKSVPEMDIEVPVSLYDGNKLLAKKMLSLTNGSGTSNFELPTGPITAGRIEIEDPGSHFDNRLYFSLNDTEPIKVVAFGSGEMSFLRRIYSEPHFEFEAFAENKIDLSKLSSADLVILNEPQDLPPSLGGTLAGLLRENAILVLIPAAEAQEGNFNGLLPQLGIPSLGDQAEQETLITDISFEHPLYSSVFEEEVRNFQYPMVKSYFRSGHRLSPILRFETGEPFLASRGNVFLFTTALNLENSNFQNSSLIVPTFYNIGNLSLKPIPLYYVLGDQNKVDVPVNLKKDEILSITSENLSFIPLQESFANKATVHLEDNPVLPGHYQLQRDSVNLKTLSFNIDRSESELNYHSLDTVNGEVAFSVPSIFDSIESRSQTDAFWKWFVIFALILLLTEMFILKLVK